MAAAVPAVPFGRLVAATGSFLKDNLLGSGATGDVFRGVLDEQPVAVKLLNLPELATPAAKAALQRMFQRELDVLGSYRNPRLVRLLHFSQDSSATSKHPFALVFELLDGGALADWLRSSDGGGARRTHDGGRPLSALQRAEIALGAARGLAFLHGQREVADDEVLVGGAGAPAAPAPAAPVLHRDVKSANIGLATLRDGSFYSKLLDCGLAKALRGPGAAPAAGHSITVTAGVLGTPGFMAPELADSGASVKSEIYAFGVVLLELLTGKRVTPREALETREAVEDEGGPAPLLARADGVWPAPAAAALADLVLQCIAAREKRRPADMPAIIDKLKALKLLVQPAAAAVPLVMCPLCLEDVPETNGLLCAGGPAAGAGAGAGGERHFTCLPCLQRHVLDCVTVERLRKTEGKIPCPGDPCASPAWTLADLAAHLEKATLTAYGMGVVAAVFDADRARREAEAERAAREAATKDAAVARDERVRRLRALIVERDLTLHCPRCLAAFLDYAGCNALACARCKCGFCAVCLQDCGGDAHGHYYATHGREIFDENAFRTAAQKRRTDAVTAALRGEADEGIRSALADALEADLKDLGIDTAAVRAAAGVRAGGAGAGAAGGAGAGAGGWACPACTLLNEPAAARCGACDAAKPAPGADREREERERREREARELEARVAAALPAARDAVRAMLAAAADAAGDAAALATVIRACNDLPAIVAPLARERAADAALAALARRGRSAQSVTNAAALIALLSRADAASLAAMQAAVGSSAAVASFENALIDQGTSAEVFAALCNAIAAVCLGGPAARAAREAVLRGTLVKRMVLGVKTHGDSPEAAAALCAAFASLAGGAGEGGPAGMAAVMAARDALMGLGGPAIATMMLRKHSAAAAVVAAAASALEKLVSGPAEDPGVAVRRTLFAGPAGAALAAALAAHAAAQAPAAIAACSAITVLATGEDGEAAARRAQLTEALAASLRAAFASPLPAVVAAACGATEALLGGYAEEHGATGARLERLRLSGAVAALEAALVAHAEDPVVQGQGRALHNWIVRGAGGVPAPGPVGPPNPLRPAPHVVPIHRPAPGPPRDLPHRPFPGRR